MITRALLSVSDKTGIVDFAKKLRSKKVELISTGGTAKLLKENGVEVTEMGDYTGHPEMMDGRVKTLHPKIHGGLLAMRDSDEHMEQAKTHGIGMIDLVVVNLYPFEATIKKPGVQLKEAVEQIDIGGPSMLRSAAKNFRSVTVITDPADYAKIWEEIETAGDTSEATRRRLAEKVFETTSRYDGAIARYLTDGRAESLFLEKITDLRYGENPHQKAAFYRERGETRRDLLANAEILQGKELSYNNLMDADATLEILREFTKPAAAFIKHTNPCGAAEAETLEDAFINAYESDPKSAFGGIVGLNRTCTADLATTLTSRFFEVVIAPDYEPDALKIFQKKPNLRVIRMGTIEPLGPAKTVRKVSGGLLIQDTDTEIITEGRLKTVTHKKPSEQELADLLFAWKIVRHVKSNAIVLAKEGMTVGVGAGQMSRVDSTENAIHKAGERAKGSVLASDAFFPFADSLEAAAKAGVTAVIQPGGSIKDDEVIAAADKLGIAMVFTGIRAFLH